MFLRKVSSMTSSLVIGSTNKLSTTGILFLDQQWRKMRQLPENPNKERILLELPDYSFKDGRPVPYGSRQKARLFKQLEFSRKIVELTKEVDRGVDLHQRKLNQEKEEKELRLSRKLRPKGAKLASK